MTLTKKLHHTYFDLYIGNVQIEITPFDWSRRPNEYNCFGPISIFIDEPQSDFDYAVKSFISARSGFERFEAKWCGEWTEVCPGEFDDYFVCAKFSDGKHIPLPILANWWPTKNRLQKIAIRMLGGGREAISMVSIFTTRGQSDDL